MTFQTQQPMTIRVQQLSPTEISITLAPPSDPEWDRQEEIEEAARHQAEKCRKWLRSFLDEQKPTLEILAAGRAEGFRDSTIHRAGRDLHVQRLKVDQDGRPLWIWAPATEPAF